jgi:hypothetical protein
VALETHPDFTGKVVTTLIGKVRRAAAKVL